jgi:hypothetical protein
MALHLLQTQLGYSLLGSLVALFLAFLPHPECDEHGFKQANPISELYRGAAYDLIFGDGFGECLVEEGSLVCWAGGELD